jgi:hypothetical protein
MWGAEKAEPKFTARISVTVTDRNSSWNGISFDETIPCDDMEFESVLNLLIQLHRRALELVPRR